jgi:hypothetical protein
MARGISEGQKEDYAAFIILTAICLLIFVPIMLG